MRAPWLIIAVCLAMAAAVPAAAAPKAAHDDCNAADPDRVIAGCSRVLADHGESDKVRAIAAVGRGLAWQQKGRRDAALADFSEAIRLNPKDSLAYSDRGVLWRELGDVDRALADFNTAIELNPQPHSDLPGAGHVNVFTNRGLAFQTKGDLDRALADFDQAIVLDPRDANACLSRARILIARHRLVEARADLDAVIRLDPQQVDAWYLRGVVRYDQYMYASAWIEPDDLDHAIADFSEAIRRDPESTAALYARALARLANGDHAGAIADLTAAAEINPFNVTVVAALKQLKPDYAPPPNPVADWVERSEAGK